MPRFDQRDGLGSRCTDERACATDRLTTYDERARISAPRIPAASRVRSGPRHPRERCRDHNLRRPWPPAPPRYLSRDRPPPPPPWAPWAQIVWDPGMNHGVTGKAPTGARCKQPSNPADPEAGR
ncbi:hypothetical protein DQP58_23510 [Mycobacterium colombiense]|uniref:Uncharacterized protein n=1 Tax=Mycobacterium colombiense TaxID=339268 RepID=A0A329K5T9_9MYCO|nr:hypothetical protein DQP58_23510 [Mycobacterium colombiense]